MVGEYLWATALGRDLYELRSIPFSVYGLNYRDVVRATRHRSHDEPEIRFVVRRSGHRTLRLFFAAGIPSAVQLDMLHRVEPLGVGFEGASDGFYALDLTPECDPAVVCRQLDEWQAHGLVDCYETCETRRAGSFERPRASTRAGRAAGR